MRASTRSIAARVARTESRVGPLPRAWGRRFERLELMIESATVVSQRHVGKPEILAPAGDRESLIAALRSGADAVYFGLDLGFNARARAANFTLEDLPATIAGIHLAGAKAYLTLNTLIFEPELERVAEVIRSIADSGADAIIVQDPAVCLLAREIAPDLHVHASTQMTISSPLASRFAQELGVTRVVVPRELSVEEIEAFRAGSGVELEVFVHGALCVSWSGQCLTSESWSGRSANRGQCAQSCRLPYSLRVDGADRDLGDVKYLLSPKDLAGARAVPDLARIGVAGLKIEGRQKGRMYVATAVEGYRRLVDGLDGSARASHEVQDRFRADLVAMTLSYTRGFSDGFLGGSDHQTLVEGRFPKHRGALLGTVERVERGAVVVTPDSTRPWTGALAAEESASRASGPRGETSAALTGFTDGESSSSGPTPTRFEPRAGMGIVFDRGEPEDKAEPGGPIFAVERRGTRIVLRFGDPGPDLSRVSVGDRAWITSDPTIQRRIEREVSLGLPNERLGVDLRVSGVVGERLAVSARCLGIEVAVRGESPLTAARAGGLDAALLREKLGSFGGTPFHCSSLDVSGLDAGLFARTSELKSMRREIVASLERAVIARTAERRSKPADVASLRDNLRSRVVDRARETRTPVVVPLCRTDEQIEAAIAVGRETILEVELDFMDLVGLKRAFARARDAGLRVTIATLRVEKPLEDSFFEACASLRPDGILVRHWSGFVRARESSPQVALHGDFSLNVTNSLTALHLLGGGLSTITPGYDLDADQLRALLARVPLDAITIPLWHRVPAFHTEHCVYSHLLSNGRDFKSCGRPCEAHRVSLIDEKRHEHPVIVDAGCRNTVFDGKPQSPARLAREWVERGVRRYRVEFLREDRAAASRVLRLALELLEGHCAVDAFLQKTGARDHVGLGEGGMATLAGSSRSETT